MKPAPGTPRVEGEKDKRVEMKRKGESGRKRENESESGVESDRQKI